MVNPSPVLESAERIAADFDVNPETLRRAYRAGRVPGYKVGRKLRFDRAEVLAAFRSDAGAPETDRRVKSEPDFGALDTA